MRRALSAVLALAFFLAASAPLRADAWDFTAALQKYRERFPTGGHGSSGTVKVQARMLYGKDGATQLEVTTGQFDSTAAPTGLLLLLKVSALNAAGKEVFSYYYYPVGATYFKQKISNLSPGQRFAIEAYAAPDWRSLLFTNRVKLTAMVQKRADLFAARIDSPARLPASIPVHIIGVITELNGQIGARTDCVLYANGVEVDRSPRIWVDSADTVSCAFSPTFPAAGLVTLTLAAEAVTPGDWDTANNTLQRTVEVLDLTPEFDVASVEAAASDIDNTTFTQVGRFVNSGLTGGYDWIYQESVDRNSDGFVYAAAALGITEVPSYLMVTATDGLVTWAIDRNVPACFDYSVGQANGRTFYTYVTGCGNLYVEIGSFAGTVTYASRLLVSTFQGTGQNVVYDGPAQIVYNDVTTEVNDGEKLFHGDVWSIDVSVTAGPFVFSAPITVFLSQTFDTGETFPYVCTTTSNTYTCNSSSWRLAGRIGQAIYTRPPTN